MKVFPLIYIMFKRSCFTRLRYEYIVIYLPPLRYEYESQHGVYIGKHWDIRYWHRLFMLASTVYETENCRAVLYSNTFRTCLHLQFFLRISPFGGCEPMNKLEMFS